jgi:serine protease Do
MRRKTLILTGLLSGAAMVGGVAVGVRFAPRAVADVPPPPAASSITPKTEVPQEARSLSKAFATTARALRPSVVRIDVEMERPKMPRRSPQREDVPPGMERFFEHFFGPGEPGEGFPSPGPGRGTGSGVVIDSAGNIITNSHVAEKASKVTVIFADGREFPAKVVGADPKTDVAVIRLTTVPPGLVAARLGNSDGVEVGEWALAIGSPLGLDQSVTAGIISGKGKVTRNVHMSGERMREYIQTDAKINPGNSGGPLVNLQGEVIGINTLINVGPGGAYGFAIPINQARRVSQAIMREGHVRHAWLGVGIGDIKDGAKLGPDGEPDGKEPAAKNGPTRAAWVSQLVPRGPAESAGVHVGDVITQIDKQKIEGAADVVDYVSGQKVGDKVKLSVLRDGKPNNISVTLGELPGNPAEFAANVEKDKIGVHLQTLTSDMARLLGMDANAKGAVVSGVEPDSRAAKAGLHAEDVIVEIDRKPVVSAEQAVEVLRAGAKDAHLLRVRRGDAFRFITIPAP